MAQEFVSSSIVTSKDKSKVEKDMVAKASSLKSSLLHERSQSVLTL